MIRSPYGYKVRDIKIFNQATKKKDGRISKSDNLLSLTEGGKQNV